MPLRELRRSPLFFQLRTPVRCSRMMTKMGTPASHRMMSRNISSLHQVSDAPCRR